MTKRRIDKDGRPIEFRLNFEEWLQVWMESGHYKDMGFRRGQYVLSRKGDMGNFEVGNCFVQLSTDNTRESKLGSKHSAEVRQAMSEARKGKPNDKKGTKQLAPAWNKGVAHSESDKAAISKGLTGYK